MPDQQQRIGGETLNCLPDPTELVPTGCWQCRTEGPQEFIGYTTPFGLLFYWYQCPDCQGRQRIKRNYIDPATGKPSFHLPLPKEQWPEDAQPKRGKR